MAGWAVSAAFLDYDNDGRLDLFVARYLDWDLQRNILCGTPFHAYCRPDKFNGVSNVLFHNEGHGRFRDVSRESGIAAVTGKGMGVAVNDYDGDGFPDIFVANDGMEQFLYHNERNGRAGAIEEKASAGADDGLSGISGSVGEGQPRGHVIAVTEKVLPVVTDTGGEGEVLAELPFVLKEAADVFFNDNGARVAAVDDSREGPIGGEIGQRRVKVNGIALNGADRRSAFTAERGFQICMFERRRHALYFGLCQAELGGLRAPFGGRGGDSPGD